MTQLKSIAMLSVHTCPVAALGGKKTGGMNVYVRELARELGLLGINVDIFTRCESPDADEIVRLGPNVTVIHIPSGPDRTLLPMEVYPHLPEFTDNVLKYQQNNHSTYDLIHAHYWLSGLVALRLQQVWNIPIVQTFHTLVKVKELFLKDLREPEERHNAELQLVQSVQRILAFTPEEQEHLKTLYHAHSTPISLVPPGIDPDRFHPVPSSVALKHIGIHAKKPLILFVGRLDPIKRLENLLKAIKEIQNQKVSLIVIGGEEQDQDLFQVRTVATGLGIQNMTSFLGSRDQRELPFYYSAARMTVIPSSYESFGLVALESMACGTPVVASRVGGLEYLIKDGKTGFLVQPESKSELSRAIVALLCDSNLHQSMSRASIRRALQFSWSHIIPRVLSVYEKAWKPTGETVLPDRGNL